MPLIMKTKHIIGSDEWKKEIICSLTDLKQYLLHISKDMKSYRLDCTIDELKQYFNENNEK
jgi:hypothetical protein